MEVKCSDYLKKLPWTFPQIAELNRSSPELDTYNIIFEPKILVTKEKMQLFAILEILANFEPKKLLQKCQNFAISWSFPNALKSQLWFELSFVYKFKNLFFNLIFPFWKILEHSALCGGKFENFHCLLAKISWKQRFH